MDVDVAVGVAVGGVCFGLDLENLGVDCANCEQMA